MINATQSAVGSQAEHLTLSLLYQLIIIFVVSRIVVWFSQRYLKQTPVAGEILAGLVLGPSLLGAFFPEFMHAIFVPETTPIFIGVAQLGLILLMFEIGLEFEFKSKLQGSRWTIIVISIVGIVVPFTMGFFSAAWFWEKMAEPRPSLFSFQLFFATAMSITAIPILGRIFIELGVSNTRTAALTIGAAAIDDVVGWVLLGVVSTLVVHHFNPMKLAGNMAILLVYLVVIFTVVRPMLIKYIQHRIRKDKGLSLQTMSVVLIALLVSAAFTSWLGIFAIIGGFIIGVALHEQRNFVELWRLRVGGLVTTLLLPIFFAYTGLRTDIGTLASSDAIIQCVLVCLIAFAGKFGGAYIACRLLGESRRESLAVGVCMNTRALMELIVLNIGYDLGVLPKQMFSMLVIMAIVSTFMATPLIRWLMVAKEDDSTSTENRAA